LTQTAIFIGADSIGAASAVGRSTADVQTGREGPILGEGMERRPLPSGIVAALCVLLVALASAMTWSAVALAADGAFQLVRVLATGDVYGLGTRIIGAGAHQGAVVLASRAGVTDTFVLTALLGVGQIMVPALAWSLAIVLSRSDALTCAAVAMVAGLSAGATWFVNVSEIVLAAPLGVLVAVLLWRPASWGWRHALLAASACVILVASYETALLTGTALALWAAMRARSASTAAEKLGCIAVASLSALSVGVAVAGMTSGANPTHAQSLLYFIVLLDPWPFYVALGAIALFVLARGPWLHGWPRDVALYVSLAALALAALNLEPGVVTAFKARGGAAVASFALIAFLAACWISPRARRHAAPRHDWLLAALPLLFVAAMTAANAQPVRSWHQSLEAFRLEVDRTHGVALAADSLPAERRDVLWGWTASSLSLVVRGEAGKGVLVDHNPLVVPFQPASADRQIDEAFAWRRPAR
jgi:hypothetical protein